MLKKGVLAAILLCNTFVVQAQKSEEPIPWRKNITMLVVPREPQAVELALDISRYYPVLLVCYQTTKDDPVLYAWNGEGWVAVSTEEYVNGTFFSTPPQQTVIVERAENAAPDMLVPDGTWCQKGYRLASTDRRVMIHLLGHYFNFPYRYWLQFAKRYDYQLEEINPSLTNVVWWHYRGDKLVSALKARDFEADMDLWIPLDITLPEPVEPVELKAPETVEPAEVPAEEPENIEKEPAENKTTVEPTVPDMPEPETDIEKIMQELSEPAENPTQKINPFSTNDVPAAELIPLPTE